jgi:predicted DNA-binding protein (UPF0251 family)
MRPKKPRFVECKPGDRCFQPLCKKGRPVEAVAITLDELEAIRLADLKGMHQEEAAKLMRVSRPTFSRIIESGRKKVADGLVNIKCIKVEGGCCKIEKKGER